MINLSRRAFDHSAVPFLEHVLESFRLISHKHSIRIHSVNAYLILCSGSLTIQLVLSLSRDDRTILIQEDTRDICEHLKYVGHPKPRRSVLR